jgi:hypothetical protein
MFHDEYSVELAKLHLHTTGAEMKTLQFGRRKVLVGCGNSGNGSADTKSRSVMALP